MSLLDEDLVDQELMEVQFKLMIDEVWERLNDGTLEVKSLKKKPLSEYEINGVGWRFTKQRGGKEDGRCLMRTIGNEVTSRFVYTDRYEKCPESEMFLDKERVKEFTSKMIDMYWGKDMYTEFMLEWRPGNYWLETNINLNTAILMDKDNYSVKQLLLGRERFILDKQLLDWINKWCK